MGPVTLSVATLCVYVCWLIVLVFGPGITLNRFSVFFLLQITLITLYLLNQDKLLHLFISSRQYAFIIAFLSLISEMMLNVDNINVLHIFMTPPLSIKPSFGFFCPSLSLCLADTRERGEAVPGLSHLDRLWQRGRKHWLWSHRCLQSRYDSNVCGLFLLLCGGKWACIYMPLEMNTLAFLKMHLLS